MQWRAVSVAFMVNTAEPPHHHDYWMSWHQYGSGGTSIIHVTEHMSRTSKTVGLFTSTKTSMPN